MGTAVTSGVPRRPFLAVARDYFVLTKPSIMLLQKWRDARKI